MWQESEPVSYPYCCGLDLDEPMIGCEMQEACDNHEWFHYCRGIYEENIPEIFLCSKCAKTNGSATCKMVTSKKIDLIVGSLSAKKNYFLDKSTKLAGMVGKGLRSKLFNGFKRAFHCFVFCAPFSKWRPFALSRAILSP